MASSRRIIGFINIGHALDHLMMLIFPTAVLGMQADFARPYSELIVLSLGGFIAFGAGAVPAGWLGDRWSRRNMMVLFFFGVGAAAVATGFVETRWQLAAGLAAIGLFAAIYHPVGTAMLVGHADRVGRAIGVNGVWGNLGVAFAALSTGALTQWVGWRWAFIVPGVAALAIGAAYWVLVPAEANRARRSTDRALRVPRAVMIRAFSVVVVATMAGGIVFNAMVVALPKMIDERLPQLAGSALAVGLLVCAVYIVGAMSQLLMGRLIDRHPIKIGFVATALFQGPLLLVAAYTGGWPLIGVLVCLIFIVFGQVTFNDGMVARYADPQWRARIYALRYLLSFGVSATAIPLVAYMHEHGGFRLLFEILAVFGVLVMLGAVCFPYRRDEIEAPSAAARRRIGARSAAAQRGGSADRAVGGAAQHRSGEGAGVAGVLDHDDPVDQHRRARAARILVGCGIGRAVGEIGRVEDRDVGAVAFAQQPAVAQPQRRGRRPGHLAHRRFERQQPLVMHVMADDAREGPVKARMRHALGDDPVIGDAIAVGADQSRRRAHDRRGCRPRRSR